MKPAFSDLAVDTKGDALLTLLNGGRLLVLSGKRPAGPDVPVSTQTLLVAIRLASPAFGPCQGGEARLNAVQPYPGLAEGRATWFRFETRQGQALFDGDCPEHLDVEQVQPDGEVFVEEFVYTEAKQ